MKVKMTDAPEFLGDVEGSLATGETVDDVRANFRRAAEAAAAELGHEIEWVSGGEMLCRRSADEKMASDAIFEKSVKIGW